jgi:hypothetical protein
MKLLRKLIRDRAKIPSIGDKKIFYVSDFIYAPAPQENCVAMRVG